VWNKVQTKWFQFLGKPHHSVKVNFSNYRPGVPQRVGRGIALLFHDRGTRRGWVISSTPRSHFTPGKDPVPIVQESGWATGPVWTGGKSRPHHDSIPELPAHSQSLYRLSYRVHHTVQYSNKKRHFSQTLGNYFTRLHEVTSHKMVTFVVFNVRSWNQPQSILVWR